MDSDEADEIDGEEVDDMDTDLSDDLDDAEAALQLEMELASVSSSDSSEVGGRRAARASRFEGRASGRAASRRRRVAAQAAAAAASAAAEVSPRRRITAHWTLYLPRPWILKTSAEPFPYTPQIGDEVAYFYQGHREYIATAVARQLHAVKSVA